MGCYEMSPMLSRLWGSGEGQSRIEHNHISRQITLRGYGKQSLKQQPYPTFVYCQINPQVLATSLSHAGIAVDEFLFRFDP